MMIPRLKLISRNYFYNATKWKQILDADPDHAGNLISCLLFITLPNS